MTDPCPDDLSRTKPLTAALEMAFADGAQKICVTKSWETVDGKKLLFLRLDTIRDLSQEIDAITASVDLQKIDDVRATWNNQKDSVTFIMDKAQFETMKKNGDFDQTDEILRRKYGLH